MGSAYGFVGPDGWRFDPWHTHEFRYYSGGLATTWVSSSGRISVEIPVSVDELVFQFAAMQCPAPVEPPVQVSRYVPVQHQVAPAPVAPAPSAPAPSAPALSAPAPSAPAPAAATTTAPAPSAPAPAGMRPGASRPVTRTPATPNGKLVAAAVGALVLVASIASFAATHGSRQNRLAGASSPRTTTAGTDTPITRPSDPSTTLVPPTASSPSAGSPPPASMDPSTLSRLQAWWTTAGQPDTQTLTADLDLLGRSAGSGSLSGECRIFATDAAATGAAPTPPAPSVEREWQQTLSTVGRVSRACAAGRYSQMAADLQPATLTIQDLTAQVSGHLGGA